MATPVARVVPVASCRSLITHLEESPCQKRCVFTYVSFPHQSLAQTCFPPSAMNNLHMAHIWPFTQGDTEVVIWREERTDENLAGPVLLTV